MRVACRVLAVSGPARPRGFNVEDKVLEDIEFHQATVSADANSPLHLIREKEMEITGRVLTAKREAEEIVARARKKAVEITHKAEEESEQLAASHEKDVLSEVEREKEQVFADTESEIEQLRQTIGQRTDAAVEFVVESVTSV